MFRNDYSEICAVEILKALEQCEEEQNVGYGLDKHSKRAKDLILSCFSLSPENSDVHFLAGGTQANAVVISYFLRPYESVLSCDTGHINVHETGAVEGSGHKVLTVPNVDGKLTAEAVEKVMRSYADEHVVKIKMVYISDSTETGTVYTKKELLSLRKVCDKYGLLLFIDGARLGVALTVEHGDVSPKDIAEVADIFYVGGTKNGAMYGEAVVIKDKSTAQEFRHHIKNRGAMLAKGFVVGIEFETLFENGLYFSLAKHTNETASVIRNGLKNCNVESVGSSPSNQIFIRVKKEFADVLVNRYGLEVWTDEGQTQVLRIVTSFKTTTADAAELVQFISRNA